MRRPADLTDLAQRIVCSCQEVLEARWEVDVDAGEAIDLAESVLELFSYLAEGQVPPDWSALSS